MFLRQVLMFPRTHVSTVSIRFYSIIATYRPMLRQYEVLLKTYSYDIGGTLTYAHVSVVASF